MIVTPLAAQLSPKWHPLIADVFDGGAWQDLDRFVTEERIRHPDQIYPPPDQVFAALNRTTPEEVRVVVLGQDPYHGPGQAHGFSFSVPPGIPFPPSLRNIMKERQSDLGLAMPQHGSLIPWADQGVLLLNTVLTVRHQSANSHRNQGWERMTDALICGLGKPERKRVFVLWGNPARKKKSLIDAAHHAIIESAHPSPLSAHQGFWGSRPFSQINQWLTSWGESPIDWTLPSS